MAAARKRAEFRRAPEAVRRELLQGGEYRGFDHCALVDEVRNIQSAVQRGIAAASQALMISGAQTGVGPWVGASAAVGPGDPPSPRTVLTAVGAAA